MGNNIKTDIVIKQQEKVNVTSPVDSTKTPFSVFCEMREKYYEDKEQDLENKLSAHKISSWLSCKINDISLLSIDSGIAELNKDNIIPALKYYKKYNGDTLTEGICDEWSFNSNKRKYLFHIANALQSKAAELGIDTTDLNLEFATEIKNAFSGFKAWFGYISNSKIQAIDDVINKYIERIQSASAVKPLPERELEPTLSKNEIAQRLEAAYEEYKDECYPLSDGEISSLDEVAKKLDLKNSDWRGNGKFDSPSIQTAGNCAAHASANALLASPKGREYLNSLIIKRDNVTAIYLPEAEGKNYSSTGMYKDGVFVANEYDMGYLAKYHSLGDGDMAALVRSMACCYNNTDGLPIQRGFEILSGQKNQIYDPRQKIPRGVGLTWVCEDIYPKLREMLFKDEGVAIVDLKGKLVDSKAIVVSNLENDTEIEQEPCISSGHGYAVVKMTDDYVYLQESNNPQVYIKMPAKEFIDCGFRICTWRF